VADYAAPSAYLPQFFGCHGGLTNGYVCDRRLDRIMARATALQLSDQRRAAAAWAKADRRITDQALWVPTANIHAPEFVSSRVRNYQSIPSGTSPPTRRGCADAALTGAAKSSTLASSSHVRSVR
jgi:ABC-type oligopeptide transport system substrate-binding subunit